MAQSIRNMELESGEPCPEKEKSPPSSWRGANVPENGSYRHLSSAVLDDSREPQTGPDDSRDPFKTGPDDSRDPFNRLLSYEPQEECDLWDGRIEISDLPALPPRTWHYYTRPFRGVFLVALMSCVLVGAVQGVGPVRGFASDVAPLVRRVLVALMWLWTSLASISVACILFASPGLIGRSEATCYPIPQEVGRRLAASESLEGMENIKSPSLGTYCVRCCLWRQGSGGYHGSHHCSDCQRCFEGHDHHCFVFGRCIVKKNLHHFFILISMPPAGFLTMLVAYFWRSEAADA